MENIIRVFGLLVYFSVVYFVFSGLIWIYKSAKEGSSRITLMYLCQWFFAIICLIVFTMFDWSKLHLFWIIPVGFFVSLSPPGRALGRLVGMITAIVFGPPGRNK